MNHYHLLSLFPNELRQFFVKGLFKKALESNKFSVDFHDLRNSALDKHSKVDDYPFGGKKGMILKPDVIDRSITSIENYQDYRLLYTCPKGRVLDQGMANELAKEPGLVILSGYYGGIDQRVIDKFPLEPVSIGNMVLSSGEIPSLCILEAVVRQLPNVLGNPRSFEEDSIVSHRLEGPVYTSPKDYDQMGVPDVLSSGHHGNINNWKHKQGLSETVFKKPELFSEKEPDAQEISLITELLQED